MDEGPREDLVQPDKAIAPLLYSFTLHDVINGEICPMKSSTTFSYFHSMLSEEGLGGLEKPEFEGLSWLFSYTIA